MGEIKSEKTKFEDNDDMNRETLRELPSSINLSWEYLTTSFQERVQTQGHTGLPGAPGHPDYNSGKESFVIWDLPGNWAPSSQYYCDPCFCQPHVSLLHLTVPGVDSNHC